MRIGRTRSLARTAAAGLITVSALGLAACGEDTAGPELGTDVEDIQEEAEVEPFEGPYDTEFYEDVESYEDEEVTVSADVNEVISPTASIIAGTDDTTVEPLLIVGADESNNLATDLTVAVTGTVHEAFELAEAEEELGVDLDDALFEPWDGEPYIVASSIDTSVPSDR